MIVRGWSNGRPNNRTGAGYGIRVTPSDRDKYFRREWQSVSIDLGSARVTARLSDSFWRSCSELRSARIGKWMLERGIAPWPKGEPPKLLLELVGDRVYRLSPDIPCSPADDLEDVQRKQK